MRGVNAQSDLHRARRRCARFRTDFSCGWPFLPRHDAEQREVHSGGGVVDERRDEEGVAVVVGVREPATQECRTTPRRARERLDGVPTAAMLARHVVHEDGAVERRGPIRKASADEEDGDEEWQALGLPEYEEERGVQRETRAARLRAAKDLSVFCRMPIAPAMTAGYTHCKMLMSASVKL